MKIIDLVKNQTTQYAKDELISYLTKITGGEPANITLALMDENSDDTFADDAYHIEITDGHGSIRGSNSRSILLGVYGYLKWLGCRFLRPGKLGEIIPKRSLAGVCSLERKAFYPYRIECLEGAVNDEIVITVLKWLPKAGFNAFYIQFTNPFVFFNRWHSHDKNPLKEPEPFTWEDSDRETERVEKFAKLLGLQLWEVGHKYMFLAFGMNYGPEWATKLSEEAKPHVALVKGEREVRGGNISFTNLCYTDPVVKKKLVDYLVDYMKKKPYIDCLALSLADGKDNQCECENCMRSTISDIYVELLNDVDAAFTENGIDVKIAFISYTATRWAPLKARLNNPSRFILNPALSRTYDVSYPTEPYTGEMPENIRNRHLGTSDCKLGIKFGKDWQDVTGCPMVFWDYHLYSAHYYDVSYMHMARIMAEDVKKLRMVGAEGLLNCKTQRAFLPTSLPIYACGELLVDPDRDYEEIVREYFDAAFGGLSRATERYLYELMDLIDPKLMMIHTSVETGGSVADKGEKHRWRNNPEAAEKFSRVGALVDDYLELALMYSEREGDATVRRSIELLQYHGEMVKRYALALQRSAEGDRDGALRELENLLDYLHRNEDNFVIEFDVYLFIRRSLEEVIFKYE